LTRSSCDHETALLMVSECANLAPLCMRVFVLLCTFYVAAGLASDLWLSGAATATIQRGLPSWNDTLAGGNLASASTLDFVETLIPLLYPCQLFVHSFECARRRRGVGYKKLEGNA
jgi:hypothetical protein